VHEEKGALKEALEGYQQALSLTEKLVEKDPLNATLKDDLKIDQRKVSKLKQHLEKTATPKEEKK